MRYYKTLRPFRALSFDLDDTLYANPPVIAAAEQAMLDTLTQVLGQTEFNHSAYWFSQRQQLALLQPEIRHDVTQWRLQALELGLITQGIKRCEAQDISEVAMSAFLAARTAIQLQPAVVAMLAELASRYPLVAITNGNADIHRMGVGQYFQFALRAGPDGRMKPFPDLFCNAAARLHISTSELLHIGDHVRSDVLGALAAGCQSVWLNLNPGSALPLLTLPHLEIEDITELQSL